LVTKTKTSIGLPQANPGNVELAVDALGRTPPRTQINNDWFADWEISQPNQVRKLLRLLGAVHGNDDQLSGWVSELQNDGEAFREELRDRTIAGYADAGCGSRQSLAWIGRDSLTTEEVKANIQQTGPLAGKERLEGGAKNAFYCLLKLHEILLDPRSFETPPEEQPPEEQSSGDTTPRDDDVESTEGGPVLQGRFRSPEDIKGFLVRLLDNQTPNACTADKIRVIFWRSGGKVKVAAEIRFDTSIESGDYGSLGRVLQKMAEAAEEETTSVR